jgi:hypothetical protein
VNEEEVNRIVSERIAGTTAEISDMIHRALAGQMDFISGKVYNNIEKRLNLERSRRGR